MNNAVVLVWYKPYNYILATCRKGTTDQWGLPGGKLEPGEEPVDGAIRELQEETGFHIDKMRLVFAKRCNDGQGITCCYTVPDYCANVFYTTPIIQQPNEGLVGWVKPKTLVEGPFGEYNKVLFDEVGIEYSNT